jgi:hypothetical protein
LGKGKLSQVSNQQKCIFHCGNGLYLSKFAVVDGWWFYRLRKTNVWTALIPDEQIKWTEREKKKYTVRQAGLKTRRSFSYTIITKNSCFWLLLFAQCEMYYW